MTSTVSVFRPWWCMPLVLPLFLGGCQLGENLLTSFFRSPERSGRMIDGKQEGEWVFRFPSGAEKAKGSYKDDKQIGPWTYWYENGNVEWEGEFDAHRLSGPSRFGYENGKNRAVGLFAGGLEEDLWTFWTSAGALDCEGDFVRGEPALRWTYYHPDGSPLAEGFRLAGERVGPWQFYSPSGEVTERRFPLPEGTQIVHESWDGSIPRREGLLVKGLQNGRWVTYHPNGRRRVSCDFVDGVPHGLVVGWTNAGELVAQGRVDGGYPVGLWQTWSGGVRQEHSGDMLDLTATFGGTWSSEGSAGARAPVQTVAVWVAEASSPPAGILDLAPDPNVAPPSAEDVARTETIPTIPLRPQPWTVRESEAIDYLVARYSNGAANVQAPRGSAYARRRSAGVREEQGGDPPLSARFLGTQLPWTRFYRGDGQVVDVDDFRGKQKVAVVVLRGFAREVCIYCATQTEALCDNIEAFRAEGCEVFVVYPGERNRLEAFLESFRQLTKREGELPLSVLYDRNMELVNRMGIASEFAIPSTFVVDERGVIRYSYVGAEIDDRPSTEDVLEAIRGLGQP